MLQKLFYRPSEHKVQTDNRQTDGQTDGHTDRQTVGQRQIWQCSSMSLRTITCRTTPCSWSCCQPGKFLGWLGQGDHSDTFSPLALFYLSTPSCSKSMGGQWAVGYVVSAWAVCYVLHVGGQCDFTVSPRFLVQLLLFSFFGVLRIGAWTWRSFIFFKWKEELSCCIAWCLIHFSSSYICYLFCFVSERVNAVVLECLMTIIQRTMKPVQLAIMVSILSQAYPQYSYVPIHTNQCKCRGYDKKSQSIIVKDTMWV